MQKVNKNIDKKYIEFEVDNYSKAKLLLNDYCINDGLRVYETDSKISDINRELVMNDISVYRIVESSSNIESSFFEMIEGKDD